MTQDPERPVTWVGEDYAEQSGHHRAFDDWFLDRHPPEPDDVVVDLGCGSGEFTARLAALVPEGEVVGVDPDPSMIEAAHRHHAANLRFIQAPAQQLDTVVEHGGTDLIVSRAMLHWLPLSAYRPVFDAAWRVLRPGGWFHSESGGAGNVAPVDDLLREVATVFDLPAPPVFPDTGRVFEVAEAAGFELPDRAVTTVAQRRTFSRDELIGFLRSQVVVALTRDAPEELAGDVRDAIMAGVDRLRRHDDTYDLTFVRLEVLARRPD